MDGKLVSVIIPVYNAEEFLGSALDSVLSQTCQNFEIIIVNDGSTDKTEKVAKDYQAKYPEKIKYFYQENKGQGSARNLGMGNASGSYFTFLDADDFWLPGKLEKQLKKLEKVGADMCFSDAEIFGESESVGKRFSEITEFYQGDILKPLIRTNFIVNSSVLMKRVVFEKIGFQNEKRIYQNIEDYDYWLRAALKDFKFVYLAEPLVKYRVHSGQNSRNSKKTLKSLTAMYSNFLFNLIVWFKKAGFIVLRMFLVNWKSYLQSK